jgi:serine/threonine protein kinase
MTATMSNSGSLAYPTPAVTGTKISQPAPAPREPAPSAATTDAAATKSTKESKTAKAEKESPPGEPKRIRFSVGSKYTVRSILCSPVAHPSCRLLRVQVQDIIGSGAYGTVCSAIHRPSGQKVAIKVRLPLAARGSKTDPLHRRKSLLLITLVCRLIASMRGNELTSTRQCSVSELYANSSF